VSLAVVLVHSSEYQDLPAHEVVVRELMAAYQPEGYNLYIDSWYSSPTLFDKLLEADMNVVGTIMLNRKNMPEELKKLKLEKGEAVAVYSHKTMVIKWRDRKNL
jgi:hypothetical protein